MSAPEPDPDQLSLLGTDRAPGAPQETAQGCLCSPLLNAYGAGLRETPCDPPTAAWLIDPSCPRHIRA